MLFPAIYKAAFFFFFFLRDRNVQFYYKESHKNENISKRLAPPPAELRERGQWAFSACPSPEGRINLKVADFTQA